MFVTITFSCIVGAAYHVKFGLAEYVFLQLGRDRTAKDMMLDLRCDNASFQGLYMHTQICKQPVVRSKIQSIHIFYLLQHLSDDIMTDRVRIAKHRCFSHILRI